MTAVLKVLVPEATSNYVLNPSFRYSATTDTNVSVGGWLVVGGLIERVLTQALYGIASLKVTTSGVIPREGAYYRVNGLAGISDPITASVYVRGSGIVHLRLIEGSKEWVSEAQALHSDRWIRFEVSGFSIGSDNVKMYVETDIKQPSVTFYVDGAQIERKAYATSFCDGDQAGCRWNVMNSSSISTRSAYTRQGGKWVTLASNCPDDSIYVTELGGLGMPPIQNNIQPWALSPGSYFQNSKATDRVVTLLFHVKNKFLQTRKKVDASPLHRLRQQLIDIFKPDVTAGDDSFLFSYQEGEREMFINLRYDGGLDGSWDIRNQWMDSLPVRFLAVDPYFYELNRDAQVLNFTQQKAISNAWARIDGEWNNLNYGFDNRVNDFAIGKYGEIIAVGDFKVTNNSALAINPLIPAHGVAYWNGTSWVALSISTNDMVDSVAVAPNGNIYVCGKFTSIGGVAANRVAYWNGTTWNALGTGLNAEVFVVEVAPNGNVFVGGDFTTAGGIAAYGVAWWDGLSWHAMGTYAGLNDHVSAIQITPDGNTVYLVGSFTDQYSKAANALLQVCSYSVSSNTFAAMGAGFVYLTPGLRLVPGNILYIGGFYNSGLSTQAMICVWNGSAWEPVGSGFLNTPGTLIASGVWDLYVDSTGNVVAVGNFYRTGEALSDRVALWNGSTWVNYDIKMPVADIFLSAALFSKDDDLFIGSGTNITNAIKCAGITYVTNNGTAETSPVIYIKGPGNLRWIENQTSKKRVYFGLTILTNEEIFIDFGSSKITSTIRGDLSYAIVPGSDFHGFSLLPGQNKIAAFMFDDSGSVMSIYYTHRHWSVDSTVKAEALT